MYVIKRFIVFEVIQYFRLIYCQSELIHIHHITAYSFIYPLIYLCIGKAFNFFIHLFDFFNIARFQTPYYVLTYGNSKPSDTCITD